MSKSSWREKKKLPFSFTKFAEVTLTMSSGSSRLGLETNREQAGAVGIKRRKEKVQWKRPFSYMLGNVSSSTKDFMKSISETSIWKTNSPVCAFKIQIHNTLSMNQCPHFHPYVIPALCLLPVASTVSYTDLCEQPDKRPCYRILKIKDHKHILPWGQFDKYHKHVLL